MLPVEGHRLWKQIVAESSLWILYDSSMLSFCQCIKLFLFCAVMG